MLLIYRRQIEFDGNVMRVTESAVIGPDDRRPQIKLQCGSARCRGIGFEPSKLGEGPDYPAQSQLRREWRGEVR
jgi:hypothetical protein